MKLTNLKINDLLNIDQKCTFLVGAGCSVSAPSCLPAGYAMMKALINHTCAQSEINNIIELMKLGKLRFEALVEIIRDQLDEDLKLIDYYDQCDKPNIQHFFLSEMIKRGNFVVTTNFDYLIEYALNQSGVPLEEIVPVITKEDFEKFADPYEQLNQGKKSLYKIHGSTKNFATQENTRESLVATIQAFGSNKQGENVFQLEPFKRPLFENITKDRSLIVMGYSGSDDFDIVPTLKILKNVQNIIWINYTPNIEMGKEQIYEINDNTFQSLDKLEMNLRKVAQILFEIWQMKNINQIYLTNINTDEMVEALLEMKPNIRNENFSLDIKEYLYKIYQDVIELTQLYIPNRIYRTLDLYSNVITSSEKILQIANEEKYNIWKAIALNDIAEVLINQGKYSEALKKLEDAFELPTISSNLSLKSTIFNNMALAYTAIKDYPAAIIRYKESINIDKRLGDLKKQISHYNNLGDLYSNQEQYSEALKHYFEGLKITEKLGLLKPKGIILNNIGNIYAASRNYTEAKKSMEEALKISEQLGNPSLKIACLANLARINEYQGNFQKAVDLYEEASEIAEIIGEKETKNSILDLIKAAKSKTAETIGMVVKDGDTQGIRKIKQDIICHPKWNSNDIKNFLKGFIKPFFDAFRDSLNWQRVVTNCNELQPNLLEISSGDNFKATFHIIEESKKKMTLQIEWEERSPVTRQVWEGITNQLTDLFKKPGIKSLKK
ncbi:MAG: tetratricopeptide repeat protein [Promethearchaeota archaeon]